MREKKRNKQSFLCNKVTHKFDEHYKIEMLELKHYSLWKNVSNKIFSLEKEMETQLRNGKNEERLTWI